MDDEASEMIKLEQEAIRFWAELGSELGFPRTVGEIYGVFFISETALSADDLAHRLGISRSGSGQALKALQGIGAIRHATGIQSRKEHYELQTDLSILLRNFLNYRIFPKLSNLDQQRKTLEERALRSENQHLVQRFNKLDRWCQKTNPVMSLLKSLI